MTEMFATDILYDEQKTPKPREIVMRLFGKKPKPLVRISGSLVLSWLFYGKSFETMFAMVNEQMKQPSIGRADRLKCPFATKQFIASSIKGCFRTQEDWDRYFTMKKAIQAGGVGEWALKICCERVALVRRSNSKRDFSKRAILGGNVYCYRATDASNNWAEEVEGMFSYRKALCQ